jgi:hypothetical protein
MKANFSILPKHDLLKNSTRERAKRWMKEKCGISFKAADT